MLVHLPVPDRDACAGHQLLQGILHGIDRFDPVVQVVHLAAAIQFRRDGALYHRVAGRNDHGLDRHAVLGRGLDQREIAHSDERHVQGARNRRCRERKDVDAGAQLLEPLFVHDAEALLLVDDDEAQIRERDVFLQQAMGADDDVDFALGQCAHGLALIFLALEARKLFDEQRETGKASAQRAVMLVRQQRRGDQDGDLLFVRHRLEGRADRDFRFAVADVAAYNAIHGARALHVGLRFLDRFALVGRFFVGERFFQLCLPRRIGRERMAFGELALRVQIDQTFRDFCQRFRNARFRAHPIRAAHFGKARRRAFRCTVFGNLMHLRDGDQHAIGACIFEVQIVLRRAKYRFGAQTQILADPMHGVHDVIRDFEVRERNGNAFFDGAQLYAFGRLPVDFAIAQHAQSQLRSGEARFDAAVVNQHASASRSQPGRMHDVGGARGARRHQHHGIAGGDPFAQRLRE